MMERIHFPGSKCSSLKADPTSLLEGISLQGNQTGRDFSPLYRGLNLDVHPYTLTAMTTSSDAQAAPLHKSICF